MRVSQAAREMMLLTELVPHRFGNPFNTLESLGTALSKLLAIG